MSIQSLTVPEKACISLKETLAVDQRAIVVIAILVGAILSPSFRLGLLTSPLGMASSLAIQVYGDKVLPKKLPPLSSKMQAIWDKIYKLSEKILPGSVITPILLGPLLEEGIFRGAIQPLLVSKVGTIAGIVLSSIPFAAVHYQADFPQLLASSFFGGLTFGILKEKVSILASLGHHVGVNAFWYLGPDLFRNYHNAEYLDKLRKQSREID